MLLARFATRLAKNTSSMKFHLRERESARARERARRVRHTERRRQMQRERQVHTHHVPKELLVGEKSRPEMPPYLGPPSESAEESTDLIEG